MAPHGGPRRTLPAGDPGSRDGSEPPVRPTGPQHDEDEADRGTREGNPRPQGVAQAERNPGEQDPTATRHREVNTPQDEAHGHVDPGGTRQAGDRDGGPKYVCSLLGLGLGAGAPMGTGNSPPMAGPEGGPVRPKAVHAQRKPAFRRARKTKRLPEPSGDPGATSSAGSCPALRLAALARIAAPHR